MEDQKPQENDEGRAPALAATAGYAFVWRMDTPSGITIWMAEPAKWARYYVVQSGKNWVCHLSTGIGYKYFRQITDETDDLQAAKAACEFHWHNSDYATGRNIG